MTRVAREVLADCELALTLLEEETDFRTWRVNWVGALALIRAVGHVLDKVDGADASVKFAARGAYRTWMSDAPEHRVFRRFIDDERNNVLKNYIFNLHPLDEVDVVIGMGITNPDNAALSREHLVIPMTENIYRPILDGYGEGEDARGIYKEALDWWHRELDAIDAACAPVA